MISVRNCNPMKKTITSCSHNRIHLHAFVKNLIFKTLKRNYISKNELIKGPLLTIIILIFLTTTNTHLAAQAFCTMACDNSVNVSLSQSCFAEIKYDMILEGTYNNNTCSPNGPSAFEVTVMGPTGAPLPTSPFVDSTHIGNSYTVKVKHPASGNSCWGSIQVEDKLAPTLICPQDITIECSEPTDPSVTGEATATDCSILSVTFNDSEQNYACNGNLAGQIIRSWSATDAQNNYASCQQTVSISRPSNSDIEWPLNLDDISAPSLDCEDPDTDPTETGTPTINGHFIPNGIGYCSIAYDYDDLSITLCENSFKILRTWTVVNWCTGTILTHTQVIAVKDKEAPVVTCPPPFVAGTTSSIQCKATVILPQATVSDNCSTIFNGSMNTPKGWINGNGGVIHNVNIGTYSITYSISDDCANTTECTTTLTVVDDDSPTVICDEFTVTTLNNTGVAIIFATTFDDGTYDNCGYFDLTVRRMEDACGVQSGFGPSVLFCCEDVDQDILVEMQATDASGNTNSCMVTVHVDDNSEPAILCPQSVVLTCQQDPTDLSLTGEPNTIIACGTVDLSYADANNLNQCDVGTITRTWTATADNGNQNSCNQLITLFDNTPVVIDFPDDYAAIGCVSIDDLLPENLPIGYDFPVVTSDCEMIATNVNDQVFTVAAPACFKIVRTWTLIDWCTYQSGGNTGIWTDTQIVMVTDTTAPVFTCPASIEISVDTNCQTTVTLPSITDVQDCSEDITIFTNSSLGIGNGPFHNVNIGQYTATYTVSDGCNNNSSCSITIDVIDGKKPTPFCKNGLITDLMGVDTDGDGVIDSGMAAVWATSLNDGSFDNCPGALSFSFTQNLVTDTLYYECEDIGQNLVQVWVTDAAGNQDYCETFVIIQDNMGVCSGNFYGSVGGAITNENGVDVQSVSVSVNDGVTPPAMTGSDGNFEFPTLPLGNDFTVTPEKDMNLLNGVTTYDMVLIHKHVLGVSALDSPYKIIAADVNNSQSVTTYDMVEMQRTILHITDFFTNNESWRFIDADYVFPNPTNPFEEDIPAIYNINNFQGNMSEVDFIAVKIGDVNDSAVPNLFYDPAEERNGYVLSFFANDAQLTANRTYRLDITAENFEQIIGYQFTLNFDFEALEFVGHEPGVLPDLGNKNFGLSLLEKGAITTSWNSPEPVDLTKGEVLFSLIFQIKTNTTWAAALDIGSNYTVAEAYFEGGEKLDVNLIFESPEIENILNTATVSPNPFHKTTVVGFFLPSAQEVTLTVFDRSGRVVETVSQFFQKGKGNIEFEASGQMPSGTYFYQLKSATFTETGKLVLVR